jgi:hypothetical protein
MAGTTFQTHPIDLNELLEDCRDGIIQLAAKAAETCGQSLKLADRLWGRRRCGHGLAPTRPRMNWSNSAGPILQVIKNRTTFAL